MKTINLYNGSKGLVKKRFEYKGFTWVIVLWDAPYMQTTVEMKDVFEFSTGVRLPGINYNHITTLKDFVVKTKEVLDGFESIGDIRGQTIKDEISKHEAINV